MSARHPIFHSGRSDWLFDLDNTLYPAELALFPQVEKRIGQYVQKLLKLDAEPARRRQKELFMAHGTTLKGLMVEYEVDPHDYLDFVGDIDFSHLTPDPDLRAHLQNLDGRKIIFTNADRPYGEKVLDRLGIADVFDAMFDVFDADFIPKPHPETYGNVMRRFDIQPGNAVFFEDMARNLVPAHEMGVATVWIDTGTDYARGGHREDRVHSTTPSLSRWLTEYHDHRVTDAGGTTTD